MKMYAKLNEIMPEQTRKSCKVNRLHEKHNLRRHSSVLPLLAGTLENR